MECYINQLIGFNYYDVLYAHKKFIKYLVFSELNNY